MTKLWYWGKPGMSAIMYFYGPQLNPQKEIWNDMTIWGDYQLSRRFVTFRYVWYSLSLVKPLLSFLWQVPTYVKTRWSANKTYTLNILCLPLTLVNICRNEMALWLYAHAIAGYSKSCKNFKPTRLLLVFNDITQNQKQKRLWEFARKEAERTNYSSAIGSLWLAAIFTEHHTTMTTYIYI